MYHLPNGLMQYHEDTLEVVRKSVNLDAPGAMKQAVDILEAWVKQQKHFTKRDFERHYLEFTIVMSKGSIERAKTKLDRSCTLKTMMPHLFVEFDLTKDLQEDLGTMTTAFMPRLTKDHDRVFIHHNSAQEFGPTVITSFIRMVAVLAEYIRRHEYCVSNIAILDYRDISIAELTKKVTVNELRQLVALLLECHGFRIKHIHILTNSKLIDLLLNTAKMVLSAKIINKIHVHKDMESLHKFVDKDVLPVEYGGKEKPLKELKEIFFADVMSEDHQEYQKQIFSARTEEELRQTDKFNETYLGMPGTFRALMVD